jgi:hypothetical protein
MPLAGSVVPIAWIPATGGGGLGSVGAASVKLGGRVTALESTASGVRPTGSFGSPTADILLSLQRLDEGRRPGISECAPSVTPGLRRPNRPQWRKDCGDER